MSTKKPNWFMKGLRKAAESRKIASQEKKAIKAEKKAIKAEKEAEKEFKKYDAVREAEQHRRNIMNRDIMMSQSRFNDDDRERGRAMEGYNDIGSKYSYISYGGRKKKHIKQQI
jgi:hypothetical protein